MDPRVSVRSTGGQLHAPCQAIFPTVAQNEPTRVTRTLDDLLWGGGVGFYEA